jgi:hypothetical protein
MTLVMRMGVFVAAMAVLGACGGSTDNRTSSASAGGASADAGGSVATGSGGAPASGGSGDGGGASTSGVAGAGGVADEAGLPPPVGTGGVADEAGPPPPVGAGGSSAPDASTSSGGSPGPDAGAGGFGEPFPAWVDACELATGLVRFQVDRHVSFGSVCIRMIVTYGIESDERYPVSLPEGWGVQSITHYADIDCITPSPTITVSEATGSVSWEATPSLVPEAVDVDIRLTLTAGVGRPGSDVIRATAVPLGTCG